MPRLLVTAAVALAAAVALPSLAQGATLHQDGHHKRILLQDVAGDTNLVSVEGSKSVVIRDINVPIKVANLPSCMPFEDGYAVRCANVRNVELDLGDGQDVVNVDSRLPVEIEGDAGRDTYIATTTGGPSQVDFQGGTGIDTANYFYATAGVNVSVNDNLENDGRAGDADRIAKDVETVFGSQFDDSIAGNDRTVRLDGNDGDDDIVGGTAAELLSGGPGNDRIDARDGALDSVDCGGWLLDRALVDPVEASITGCAEVVG
jgi:Ca2+-binding RTX toxin-like protein